MAHWTGGTALADNPNVQEDYTEGPIAYDKNGNIMELQRFGMRTDDPNIDKIDILTYSYLPSSNRLVKVTDAAGTDGFSNGTSADDEDYKYDVNGNMTTDRNKNIRSISYNHMNLPTLVQFRNGGSISFIYDATGAKIRKTVTQRVFENDVTTVTDYAGGFIYINGVLQHFGHAEGYVSYDAPTNKFKYIYQYKDHLGNSRVSFTDSSNGVVVVEENHYYAFGLKHRGYGAATTGLGNAHGEQYKYNGKELQDELGLNMYDYGARNYDPAIGRWMNIDPLAEVSRRWSPYTYCYDNPIRFVDPDGMMAIWKPNKDGSLTAEKGDNAATLAKFLGTTASDVGTRFKKEGKSIGANHQFKEGEKVKLDNNATRAISRSKGGSVAEINAGKAEQDVKNDNYICDQCAQMAANGEEITPANAEKYDQFPNPIARGDSTPGFSQVDSFDNVKFNEGIASIGGQHTVSFYGKSKDGTVYVLTKDGREAKPQVLPLTQVINAFNQDQGTNFTMKDVRYYKKDETK